jgi:hypothetical protein
VSIEKKEIVDGLFRIVKEGNTDHSVKVKKKFIPSGHLA